MTYEQTLDWMFGRLPMYQKQGQSAFKPKLTNTINFVKHLGNPEKNFKAVHVAGTNGKGSTSHMLASILQEAGYKVGLYTSPHLKDFRERIKINGKEISEESVVSFIAKNKAFLEEQSLSFFEMTVGMAFHYFSEEKVDIAIIEVGLGGRYDSTNIIVPEISVITNIGFDHTDMLGDTLEKIAWEKAGIIKQTVPVVVSEYNELTYPVFQSVAIEKDAPIFLAEEIKTDFKSDLLGSYQKKNIKAVIATIERLKGFTVTQEHIKSGLLNTVKNTGLLGRWQILGGHPKIICDTAHNKEGLSIVISQLLTQNFTQLHLILGFVKDKNLDKILPLFPENAKYYFCSPKISRGLDVEKLLEKATCFNLKGETYSSVSEALQAAKSKASKNDLIYVGGSTFVVSEII
ncbi:bifunctional folylpolyglutamate synthase/dihydrofolate synthase [Galbibacter pacificus]|uniref:Dihydrofolate synthase/folylpolyglutamate synthase n=1 Tax=Galbibacter pacificus TaxID=2996052 RepID=A0ABT6FVU7_9FLAO|nr:folylpolyglutamate synthase/dihydrofolate synthase family protein [Galbibacter pacificus]MDG3583695.1 bifunctional folylpolyglutamate synthase/dihydrofolate synthase [Galbibacter pacificus]MDG3587387.1 bifunctional folylpolyglutamate synthase/dihydrofolate synthase [Galbibacter pacificus]